MSDGNGLEAIPVTVTFLEMKAPPSNYSHPPMNRQIALLKTRHMPLHFYRYLMDRVGRKWHWVNVLRLSDEELAAGIHSPGRDIRVLYLDGAPTILPPFRSTRSSASSRSGRSAKRCFRSRLSSGPKV
jgi:hypothetical protein